LRATDYCRQSIFFIRQDISDSRLLRGWQAHRAAFLAAISFLPWKTTIAELPFENARMRAYLLSPDHTSTARPTILAPCGSKDSDWIFSENSSPKSFSFPEGIRISLPPRQAKARYPSNLI
jgi:hypothetical protein